MLQVYTLQKRYLNKGGILFQDQGHNVTNDNTTTA
jgi:hypothetical protein